MAGSSTAAHAEWPVNALPNFASDLFDSDSFTGVPLGMVTDYYHQMSLGQYTVLGDYYDTLITFPTKGTSGAEVDPIHDTAIQPL